MADKDGRTEKPTAKRKQKSRREGQVAKSQDLGGWIVILAASVLIPHLFRSSYSRLTALFGQVAQVMGNPSQAGALSAFSAGLRDTAAIVFPYVSGFAAIGLVANLVQTRGLFSLQAAAPRFSRLNPIAGVKRLFSVQSLWQLGKQVLRLGVLVAVAYPAVSHMGKQLVGTAPVSLTPLLSYSGSEILGLVRDVAFLGVLLSLGDYAIQRRRLNNQLKMTKEEVKEEHKQSQGDPIIKGKIRRQQLRLSRSRMMAAVVGADVVVTNPTHYAVALRYEAGSGRAPTVVAKGADEMALRIREQAKSHQVPVVEDPPLARAVYAMCDIDEQIPHELYMAVARLLAFVFTLPALAKASGIVHRRPTSALVA